MESLHQLCVSMAVLLAFAGIALMSSAMSFAPMVDSGYRWFLVLPGLFDAFIGVIMIAMSVALPRVDVNDMQIAELEARMWETAALRERLMELGELRERQRELASAVDSERDAIDHLLASRTHPEDPANESECAICLDRMDSIKLGTTVHPDTGHVHVDVERVPVVKCSRCKCGLHVSCLCKMMVGGGGRCPGCDLRLTGCRPTGMRW